MTKVKQISQKELTATEILAILEDGGRVLIEMSVLGKTTNVSIRQQSGTYYCDTPVKLMKYDTQDELQKCLERFRLVRREDSQETDAVNATA